MPRVAQSDVRQKILDAAEQRLWHYGFKKTTIDEIAADAGVGKGTVYLYFECKEDIALAIVARFKAESLEHLRAIASDPEKDHVQKLKEMLTDPILKAHERCLQSPSALELILAVRPHIQAHLKPYLDREVALIAEVLEDGNHAGRFAIDDSVLTAQTLKRMCSGFMPPYPCVEGTGLIQAEVARIVDLAYCGFRRTGFRE